MGEPLYSCQPPTGYSDRADAWVNSGALIARLNFALALASDALPGTSAEPRRLISDSDAANTQRTVVALARVLLNGSLSASSLETIQKRLSDDGPAADGLERASVRTAAPVPTIAGLILGSPEFQKQ
jgi:hypothetical protein